MQSNAWDSEDKCDSLFISKWKSFLELDLGRRLVSNWNRLWEDTYEYQNEYDETSLDVPDSELQVWMYISRLLTKL